MKWIITDHVHYDRVAACWAIKRFIDKDAQFLFAPRATPLDQLPKDATPLAFPGVELGPHDEAGTLTDKVLRKYQLAGDPALKQIADIVRGGVRYWRENPRPTVVDRPTQVGIGLITLADGMVLMYPEDQARLDASYPTWDAMHMLCKANKQRV